MCECPRTSGLGPVGGGLEGELCLPATFTVRSPLAAMPGGGPDSPRWLPGTDQLCYEPTSVPVWSLTRSCAWTACGWWPLWAGRACQALSACGPTPSGEPGPGGSGHRDPPAWPSVPNSSPVEPSVLVLGPSSLRDPHGQAAPAPGIRGSLGVLGSGAS